MREGKWKFHLPLSRGNPTELYNLSIDPSESNTIADTHPQVIQALRKKLSQWM